MLALFQDRSRAAIDQRAEDVMTDRTENAVSVEQRPREGEARLRLLTEASSDVLYRMSPDWGEMKELSGGGFLPSTPSSKPNRS